MTWLILDIDLVRSRALSQHHRRTSWSSRLVVAIRLRLFLLTGSRASSASIN